MAIKKKGPSATSQSATNSTKPATNSSVYTGPTVSTGPTTDPIFHTGRPNFDNSRIKPKGLGDKPEKPIRGEFGAYLGDVVDGFGRTLLSPNTGMILGYIGAGACLTVSTIGYANVLGWTPLFAAPLALVSQFIQLLPRLPKYFPEQADRLTLKLGMTRYLDPTVTKDSPTLLGEVKEWSRNAYKKRQAVMETASASLYLMEFIGAANAFQIINPITMQLIPAGVFAVIAGVVGFELCLIFVEWMKGMRLTGRQSRLYKQKKAAQQMAADQSFN